jgi:competence CoiA-like predicted nuclease
MDYAIRHVYDPCTSELYDAQEVFKHRELAYAFRKDFHANDQTLLCCACDEKATISLGSKGTMHFKHFPNTPDCDLKDGSYTRAERQLIEEHYANKERPRHKKLKQAIGDWLKTISGVDAASIYVDNKFLRDKKEKRRPDVLCNFNGKKIAFEIQLSTLPPKYIFKRHDFYKRNEIYLIWILDDFDPSGQSQTEKDIKYLNKHQNFFFFNDASPNHSLVAQYKIGRINHSLNKTYFKWTHDLVDLKALKYDEVDFQCYFISFEDEQSKLYTQHFKELHKDIVDNLREFYVTDDERLIPKFHQAIEALDFDDLSLLEKVLGIDRNNDLFSKAAKLGKSHFLLYFLETSSININLNKGGDDRDSLLQSILTPSKILYRWKIVHLIFHHGYRLTTSDRAFLKTFDFHEELIGVRVQRRINIYAYNALGQRTYIEWYEKIDATVYTILSAKFNQIVGHGFSNFISLANNAIHNYKATYAFIEQAFKYYKIWEKVTSEDQKKTFFKKRQEYLAMGSQLTDSQGYFVLKILFAEVFNPNRESVEWIKLEDFQ